MDGEPRDGAHAVDRGIASPVIAARRAGFAAPVR
jgi:hypothetical protein